MRSIKKRNPPDALTEWRQQRMARNDAVTFPLTYGALRASGSVCQKVEAALIAEQGGICAYTGRRITAADHQRGSSATFHVEHLLPQTFCTAAYGHEWEDTDFQNLVACWPKPNAQSAPGYGACKKGGWPSPAEQHLFVSPLDPSCQQRFRFEKDGVMKPTNENDQPARLTIEKLGLNDSTLVALRKEAILGAIFPNQKRLNREQQDRVVAAHRNRALRLDQGGNETLTPYCFAIESALSKSPGKTN